MPRLHRNNFLILISTLVSFLHADIIQPNIVLFYVDDLGWQDTELDQIDDGAPVPWKTPNIVSLANDGIRFTEGYSPAPTCAPSRVAIMSGKHPARTGKTHVIGGAPPMPINNNVQMVSPFWPGRMEYSEYTIAEALSDAGYYTGHVGKWHCAINHHASPTSDEQGFEYVSTALGVTAGMTDITTGFATTEASDAFQLQETLDSSYGDYAGLPARPYDATTEDALTFLRDSVSQQRPFFLYLAHFMVHTPIQMRDENLLKYYSEQMGYDYDGTNTPATSSDDLSEFIGSGGYFVDPSSSHGEGQKSPYYAAMCDTLDWSLGKIVSYLKNTSDPRNPGYTLFETTYIVFTSDNGGMEGSTKDHITDNAPLTLGKLSANEGGIRVPFIITGPHITPNSVSYELINGLDLYPTFQAIADAPGRESQNQYLDGENVLPYLIGDTSTIQDTEGNHRDTLYWHFPHSLDTRMKSAIRKGNYKLFKNYLTNDYNLYHLGNWESPDDLSESNDLYGNALYADISSELSTQLEAFLTQMGGQPGYFSPTSTQDIPNKELVPDITEDTYDTLSRLASVSFETDGKSSIERAYLTYTMNGGATYEEWFQMPATVEEGTAYAILPQNATHYVFNLIDENNFIRSSFDFDKTLTPYSTQLPTRTLTSVADRLYILPHRTAQDHTIAQWRFDSSEFGSSTHQLEVAGGHSSGISISNSGFMSTGLYFPTSVDSSTSDRIEVIDSSNDSLFPTSSDPSLSVECWVNFASLATGQAQFIVNKYNTSGGYCLYQDANTDKIGLRLRDNTGNILTLLSPITGLSTDKWCHLAFSWNGISNTATLYLNGAEIASNSTSDLDILTDSSSLLTFGNSTSGAYPFHGTIDEVRMSAIAYTFGTHPELPNEFLLTDDTLSLYQMNASDEGASDGLISLEGDDLSNVMFIPGTGFTGSSLHSNSTPGSEDLDRAVINASNSAGLTYPSTADPSFSAEAWVRFDSIDALDDQQIFNSISGTQGFQLLLVKESTRIRAQLRNGVTFTLTSQDTNIAAEEWHHIAISWNNTTDTLKIYLDFAEIASATNTEYGMNGFLQANELALCNFNLTSGTLPAPLHGYIDGIRFLSSAKDYSTTSSDLSENYLSWQREHFNTNQIALGNADPDADPDGDSHSNYAEFLLNLAPDMHSPSVISIDSASTSNHPTISYTSSKLYPSSYTIKYSTDLESWTEASIGADLEILEDSVDLKNGNYSHKLRYINNTVVTPNIFFSLTAEQANN